MQTTGDFSCGFNPWSIHFVLVRGVSEGAAAIGLLIAVGLGRGGRSLKDSSSANY
jgi:hypothetical protein